MIEEFEAHHYGCLRDVRLKLTPLHAFIGPNDSGKSTILSGVRIVTQCAGGTPSLGLDSIRFADNSDLRSIGPSGSLKILKKGKEFWRGWEQRNQKVEDRLAAAIPPDWRASVAKQFQGSATVRFDPAALRRPSKLIPEGKQVQFVDEGGIGLPGIYQAILGRGDELFTTIRDSVRRHFPTVKNLRVIAVSETELTLETELTDGASIRPEFMSDGLLYYLGFAAIPYLARVSVMLIEEPENGLHPARIRDVISILREFVKSSKTQVLMATHSPLVVNELEPNEVTVVTRDAKRGTQVQLIKDTPNFERRSKTAALGELWLSYADGDQETPLLNPKSAAG